MTLLSSSDCSTGLWKFPYWTSGLRSKRKECRHGKKANSTLSMQPVLLLREAMNTARSDFVSLPFTVIGQIEVIHRSYQILSPITSPYT